MISCLIDQNSGHGFFEFGWISAFGQKCQKKKIKKKNLNIWKHLACNYPARKLKKRFITVSKCLKRWFVRTKMEKHDLKKQLRSIFFALVFFRIFPGFVFVRLDRDPTGSTKCLCIRALLQDPLPMKSPSGKLGAACMWYIDVQPTTLFDYFLPM